MGSVEKKDCILEEGDGLTQTKTMWKWKEEENKPLCCHLTSVTNEKK